MLSCGYSNKQIATMLEITESTVKSHVSSLLKAVACTNRTQLAVTVLEQNRAGAASEIAARR
jgi:DNA-binding NarL/FixJ family response regulator